VAIQEGDNDCVKVYKKLRLNHVKYGSEYVCEETCLVDPITQTEPSLTRACYLRSDCLKEKRIQCLYNLDSLCDLMQRGMCLSPHTRKPFTRSDIYRVYFVSVAGRVMSVSTALSD